MHVSAFCSFHDASRSKTFWFLISNLIQLYSRSHMVLFLYIYRASHTITDLPHTRPRRLRPVPSSTLTLVTTTTPAMAVMPFEVRRLLQVHHPSLVTIPTRTAPQPQFPPSKTRVATSSRASGASFRTAPLDRLCPMCCKRLLMIRIMQMWILSSPRLLM